MTIPAGKFKAKCLKLMDRVEVTHEEIVITKHGKPVAKLVAVEEEKSQSSFGCRKNSVTILADIVEKNGDQWDAEGGKLLNE